MVITSLIDFSQIINFVGISCQGLFFIENKDVGLQDCLKMKSMKDSPFCENSYFLTNVK